MSVFYPDLHFMNMQLQCRRRRRNVGPVISMIRTYENEIDLVPCKRRRVCSCRCWQL